LPVILVASVALKLKSEAITALLGAIIGYIFGSSNVSNVSPPNSAAPDNATTIRKGDTGRLP
jgi:hypothetical protein